MTRCRTNSKLFLNIINTFRKHWLVGCKYNYSKLSKHQLHDLFVFKSRELCIGCIDQVAGVNQSVLPTCIEKQIVSSIAGCSTHVSACGLCGRGKEGKTILHSRSRGPGEGIPTRLHNYFVEKRLRLWIIPLKVY